LPGPLQCVRPAPPRPRLLQRPFAPSAAPRPPAGHCRLRAYLSLVKTLPACDVEGLLSLPDTSDDYMNLHAAVLKTVTSLIQIGQTQLVETLGLRYHHGLLPSLLRRAVSSIVSSGGAASGESPLTPARLKQATAILSTLYHITSSHDRMSPSPACWIRYCSWCSGRPLRTTGWACASGLSGCWTACATWRPARPACPESCSPPCSAGCRPNCSCRQQQPANCLQKLGLLKRLLHLLKRLVTEPDFADSVRRTVDSGQLLRLVRCLLDCAPALRAFAGADLLAAYIQHEPSSLSAMQESGITDQVLDSLKVPQHRDLLLNLPPILAALSLNQRGADAVLRRGVLQQLVSIFADPAYLPALTAKKSMQPAAMLGSLASEVVRNDQRLKDAVVEAVKGLPHPPGRRGQGIRCRRRRRASATASAAKSTASQDDASGGGSSVRTKTSSCRTLRSPRRSPPEAPAAAATAPLVRRTLAPMLPPAAPPLRPPATRRGVEPRQPAARSMVYRTAIERRLTVRSPRGSVDHSEPHPALCVDAGLVLTPPASRALVRRPLPSSELPNPRSAAICSLLLSGCVSISEELRSSSPGQVCRRPAAAKEAAVPAVPHCGLRGGCAAGCDRGLRPDGRRHVRHPVPAGTGRSLRAGLPRSEAGRPLLDPEQLACRQAVSASVRSIFAALFKLCTAGSRSLYTGSQMSLDNCKTIVHTFQDLFAMEGRRRARTRRSFELVVTSFTVVIGSFAASRDVIHCSHQVIRASRDVIHCSHQLFCGLQPDRLPPDIANFLVFEGISTVGAFMSLLPRAINQGFADEALVDRLEDRLLPALMPLWNRLPAKELLSETGACQPAVHYAPAAAGLRMVSQQSGGASGSGAGTSAGAGATGNSDNQSVRRLMEMGFSRRLCVEVLRVATNFEEAVDTLVRRQGEEQLLGADLLSPDDETPARPPTTTARLAMEAPPQRQLGARLPESVSAFKSAANPASRGRSSGRHRGLQLIDLAFEAALLGLPGQLPGPAPPAAAGAAALPPLQALLRTAGSQAPPAAALLPGPDAPVVLRRVCGHLRPVSACWLTRTSASPPLANFAAARPRANRPSVLLGRAGRAHRSLGAAGRRANASLDRAWRDGRYMCRFPQLVGRRQLLSTIRPGAGASRLEAALSSFSSASSAPIPACAAELLLLLSRPGRSPAGSGPAREPGCSTCAAWRLHAVFQDADAVAYAASNLACPAGRKGAKDLHYLLAVLTPGSVQGLRAHLRCRAPAGLACHRQCRSAEGGHQRLMYQTQERSSAPKEQSPPPLRDWQTSLLSMLLDAVLLDQPAASLAAAFQQSPPSNRSDTSSDESAPDAAAGGDAASDAKQQTTCRKFALALLIDLARYTLHFLCYSVVASHLLRQPCLSRIIDRFAVQNRCDSVEHGLSFCLLTEAINACPNDADIINGLVTEIRSALHRAVHLADPDARCTALFSLVNLVQLMATPIARTAQRRGLLADLVRLPLAIDSGVKAGRELLCHLLTALHLLCDLCQEDPRRKDTGYHAFDGYHELLLGDPALANHLLLRYSDGHSDASAGPTARPGRATSLPSTTLGGAALSHSDNRHMVALGNDDDEEEVERDDEEEEEAS
uniref:UBA domain-containing protein n=1 Tax=Macrostomum lignano TaxID=282301 RepID=A0A1I8F288_9PLAT